MNVKITAIRSIAMGDQMLSNCYYYFKSQKKELFWRSERKLLRLSTSEVHDRTKERETKKVHCVAENTMEIDILNVFMTIGIFLNVLINS